MFLLTGFIVFFLSSGCGKQDETVAVSQNMLSMADSLMDKPLTAYQYELLDIAFETATMIPVKPHIKDRSRAQEKVVVASLELDQPQRVMGLIEKIDNWRRGACLAELAFYCARHGYTEEALKYAERAGKIADSDKDWRGDRIRVKIANAYILLGQPRQADQFEEDVVDSELGKVAVAKAMIACDECFDEQLEELDRFMVQGNFDVLKNVLKAAAELFNRFYEDPDRRSLAEEKLKSSWGTLPAFIRLELLADLIGFALDHGDQGKALELIDEAQLFMDTFEWPLEYYIQLRAKLVELRFRAGDKQRAGTDADVLLAIFDAQGEEIVNIYRAGTLRPLAEAYVSLGDITTAKAVYKRAVEAGIDNPNSRPRAEDLSATCISMALHGVEPDAELLARIQQIYEGLGDPW